MRTGSMLARVALALALAGAPALAGDASQDEILAAVRAGEARPLAEIEAMIAPHLPGKVIRVEAERKRRGFIYEFKTLDAQGRRAEVKVDAATGEILKVERK